jgi:hypothetical protein
MTQFIPILVSFRKNAEAPYNVAMFICTYICNNNILSAWKLQLNLMFYFA